MPVTICHQDDASIDVAALKLVHQLVGHRVVSAIEFDSRMNHRGRWEDDRNEQSDDQDDCGGRATRTIDLMGPGELNQDRESSCGQKVCRKKGLEVEAGTKPVETDPGVDDVNRRKHDDDRSKQVVPSVATTCQKRNRWLK